MKGAIAIKNVRINGRIKNRNHQANYYAEKEWGVNIYTRLAVDRDKSMDMDN